ncbi:transketolase family protein [Mycetocola reblochoni]|uniref:Transketolase, C-terminal section n=2 Tax=Mycetocola reblochoni TaxID=331618 RepID=A0A1R4IH78_9MICO|nr:transketolase C-terminal domain-containing protein [Mycetocola reblochoni]RLP69693.1 transketolase family protein [Mycetocola reblochoni]SJN19079.1 Transketolase, C-terminal section [Mycetocola reblochoni REB411]
MTAQRKVWGDTLLELTREDDRVVVLDADLATSTMAVTVAEGNPEAFIQVGIAEQNLVGMAFGLSTMGYRPWLSTFGVFLTHRALDQIRMLVSQTGAPVRIAAAYAGLLNGSSGKTHQDIEDLAIMRAMPGMTVLAPADEHEARAITRWAAEHDGPVYIRYARDAVAPVFDADYVFHPGAVHRLRDGGGDVTLVSTGVQSSRVVEAAELLAARGVDARVVHVPSLKPVDGDALLAAISGVGTVVTVEDHSVINGLGGLVAELIAERGDPDAPRLHRVGLADGWSESAPNAFLLDRYGLSAERVAEQVLEALGHSPSPSATVTVTAPGGTVG